MDAHYIAQLARLELSTEEEQRLGGQVDAILGYIEQLKRLDVSGVEPMAHAVPQINVTRPDEIRPGLSQAEALQNAPSKADGLFIVPKIVE
jgi:aspartyl-tRNA(Asn)/glutamyl-tRNA(Gln) amidotransferase subunit C